MVENKGGTHFGVTSLHLVIQREGDSSTQPDHKPITEPIHGQVSLFYLSFNNPTCHSLILDLHILSPRLSVLSPKSSHHPSPHMLHTPPIKPSFALWLVFAFFPKTQI